MRTQKETKAGEQRETLDIVVFDNGVEKPFENYSGGEQTIINLAIRLALSRIISSLHGVQMQSLFLDEVLAELDEVNREEAIKVIAYLSKSFEQIFVISHTDEVKDIIDSSILVERYESHSEVRITDGRTRTDAA
jgi:exonuclease SbcC